MWVFLKGTAGKATYVEVPNFENTQDLMWRKVAVPQKPKKHARSLSPSLAAGANPEIRPIEVASPRMCLHRHKAK